MIQLCRMNSTAEVKASTRASPSRRRCPCTSRCSQRPAGSVAVMAWRPSSVVTLAGTHLAAEYPVGPGGIGEDDGNHEEHARSEEHTSELQSRPHLVCRLLLEKKKKK